MTPRADAAPRAELERLAARFDVPGRLVSVAPTGRGNVNDTYLAVFRTHFDEQKVILQRINNRVFSRPDWVTGNLRVLTDHAHRRLAREAGRSDRVWQLPRLVPARSGRDLVRDGRGGFWRALTYIASASSYDLVQGEWHAFEAGTVLGQFHRIVSDLEPARLRDTLPGFHQTPLYLERYDRTAASPAGAARLKKSAEARKLARFVDERRSFAGALETARMRGELAERLIHGDPKVSNVMIDDLTRKGTAIVDLDTVKPGLIHYDFGDALRSIANPAGEEAERLSSVRFDVALCRAFVEGYLSRARGFLTASDRRYLFDAVRLIAFELGLRFFEDHLAGDAYFRVAAHGHNLARARVQLALCADIERREREIRAALAA